MRKTVAAVALVALSGAAVIGFAVGRSTAAGGPKSYFAVLNTGQEVPQGGPPPGGDGFGVAHFVLHPDRTFCTNMTVGALDGTISGAHIHKGRVGENGEIVIALETEAGGVWRNDCDTSEKLTRAEVDLLNQRRLYVNVHTSPTFADGEVRGQIGKL